MLKKIVLSFIFVFTAASLMYARDLNFTGRFVPNDGSTLVFAGQNNRSSDNYVKSVKNIPAGFMIYTALSDLAGLDEAADFGAGETSGAYILKKYPKAALQIGLYLVNSLDEIIDGSLDENITKLGNWIKKSRVPVYLRIGYEFDYPENGYEPEKYIKAYRRIVDKMDEDGVKNAAYVWHSYAALNPRGIEAWYPGDEYVDWCAISYFSNPQWIPMVKFAQRHSKPLMIAECAPMLGHDLREDGKLKWYDKFFRFINTNNIKALCYINNNWDELPMFKDCKWGNSTISDSKLVQKMWLNKISDRRFVNLESLYDSISFSEGENVLIVFCHPDNENSSSAMIFAKVKETLGKNGIPYKIRDLYAMKFNPVLDKAGLEDMKNKKISDAVAKEQKYFKEAGTVVFIYPLWWSGVPAMLKGYIDRVFYPGFAFEFEEAKGTASIKHKKAVVFTTMAMSEKDLENSDLKKALDIIYDDKIFGFSGLKARYHGYFGSLPATDVKDIEAYLSEVEKIINLIN